MSPRWNPYHFPMLLPVLLDKFRITLGWFLGSFLVQRCHLAPGSIVEWQNIKNAVSNNFMIVFSASHGGLVILCSSSPHV